MGLCLQNVLLNNTLDLNITDKSSKHNQIKFMWASFSFSPGTHFEETFQLIEVLSWLILIGPKKKDQRMNLIYINLLKKKKEQRIDG